MDSIVRRMVVRGLCALFMAGAMALAVSAAAHAQPPVQTPAEPRLPAGEVVEIHFAGQADANRLAARLDVWEVDHQANTLVAYVSPQERAELRLSGYTVRSLVDTRASELLPASIPNFACYRTVEETYAGLAALAVTAPNLAEWVDIGDSWRKTQNANEGYDLRVLVLTNEQRPGPKPRLFVMAAIHARELTTAEVATRFAEQLVAAYGSDPDVTFLLDYAEIHILPQANPDGRKRAEADAGDPAAGEFESMLWRKNVNNMACAGDRRYGVDLNRNSSFRWASCEFEGCSSSDPCSLTYHGMAPASEPETQAIEAYLRSLFPDRRGPADTDAAPTDTQGVMISLHSYSQLVLFPWGWRAQPSPNDAGLRTLGRKFGYFTGYETCQSGEDYCIYMTDGTTDDFSYGELGVASYTFELGTRFFETCSNFEVEILPQTLAALRYAAKVAVRPYTLAAGPDVVTAAVTPAIVGAGSPLLLTAQLDDSRTLAQSSFGAEPVEAIAGATYTVDAPSWSAGALPGGSLAAVGIFDSARESATASIDTQGWAVGRHTIFVEATDAAGHMGPPTAVFVEIGEPVFVPYLDTGR